MNTAANLVILFLVCCIISVLYWRIIRPPLIRLVRFRLFDRRDELRRLAIDGQEDHCSFAYREVEGFICKTISVVSMTNLMAFVIFMVRNPITEPSAEMKRVRQESSGKLNSFIDETVKDALALMTFNSPILLFLAAVTVLLLWLSSRLSLIYRRTEYFVNTLPAEPGRPQFATA